MIKHATNVIYGGEAAVQDLAADVSKAFDYLDQHIDGSQAWVKGVLMETLLQHHPEFVASIDDGLMATRKCLRSTSAALGQAGSLYDSSEADAQALIRELFSALDDSTSPEAITGSTPRRGRGVTEPSSALVTPTSAMSDPAFVVVWDVLNWPSYLSVSHWLRQALRVVVNIFAPHLFQGRDPLEYAIHILSGDWDQVAIAGSAFGHLGNYYAAVSDALNDVGVDVFSEWSDGAGADVAGEYFAELVAVMARQTAAYADLDTKYTNAAWAAFAGCQAVMSAVDALVDAWIAAALTGKSIGEILLAPLTAGATIPAGVVSATIALTQALSAAWSLTMTAASTFIAVGAGLGSARQEIEFIRLPEV